MRSGMHLLLLLSFVFVHALAQSTQPKSSPDRALQNQTNYTITNIITDSANCTAKCLDLGNVFCRSSSNVSQGVCCGTADQNCQQSANDGYCSNSLISIFLYPQVCPYESNICGPNQNIVLNQNVQYLKSQPGFGINNVCSYQITAPRSQTPSGFVYFQLIAEQNTGVNLTITQSLTSNQVITCQVSAGQMIAAVVPNQIFVTFRSQASDAATFYFSASYSATNTNNNLANYQVCTDKGVSLSGVPNSVPNQNSQNTQKTGAVISVTNIPLRSAIMKQLLSIPMPDEKFPTNIPQTNAFSTVDIVLLILASILLLMSCIIFTNIYLAKKNLELYQAHAEDIRRIRELRVQQRNNQPNQATSSEESEDNIEAQRQYERVAALNTMLAQNRRLPTESPLRESRPSINPAERRNAPRRQPLVPHDQSSVNIPLEAVVPSQFTFNNRQGVRPAPQNRPQQNYDLEVIDLANEQFDNQARDPRQDTQSSVSRPIARANVQVVRRGANQHN